MLRKFYCLMIAVLIAGSLAACNKNGKNGASSTGETTASNPNGLPSDIPVHPASEFIGKRTDNQKEIFDFKVKASVLDVANFYDKEMKKHSWALDPNPDPTQSEGIAYFKSDRAVKVVSAKKDDKTEVELVLSAYVPRPETPMSPQAEQALRQQSEDDIKGDPESVKALKDKNIHLGELLKFPADIPDDVPRYPGAAVKEHSLRPMKWREFTTQDSVEQIASFYPEKMTANGWHKHLDTSERGDSMVVYAKDDGKGGVRYIGVRVNNMKDYRNLTVILYPENVVIPPNVKTITQLIQEQKGTYDKVQEAQREAQEKMKELQKKAEKAGRKAPPEQKN